MPDPSPNPKRPATLSGGIHMGDLTGERDVNITLTDVAGGDQIKITNAPGATVIKEAPRKLTREEQLAQRNRHTMLLKVKAYWIDGVLANSLHSKVIPLDMERKPDAVTRPRPWDVLWQHRNQQPQPLPPGTKIVDRFNYAAGDALLILGEPGSGKTTMLLELAGELLEWAEQNEALRIPVVFNLSSWAVLRPPLTEWLVSELQTLYLIPKKVAQSWVEQDDILPLLDGLDEVAQEHRAVCIKAINAYREAQGTPLVVCSRIADYEAIGEKLLLSDALLLRPLTPQQINDYLLAGGPTLDGVRLGLQEDEVLREMAQSPLMLSIMAVAYRDQTPEQFANTNLDQRGRQLFATYIHHQLPQRRQGSREDPATTLRRLTYLARQMTICDQTFFLIERLQPIWLTTASQQSRYRWMVTLVFGLLVGLILGLTSVLAGGGFYSALLSGLLGGLTGGVIAWQGDIKPTEVVSWSWQHVSREKVIGVSISGIAFGLVAGLFEGWTLGVVIGLGCTLVGWATSGLISGLVELRTSPNEGMQNSAQNALTVALFIGFIGGLVGGWAGMIGSGLGSGLAMGGGAVLKHYTLRSLLHHYGYLPFNLVPFLDLAAERLILQKVGGGYRFVHRLLQEYLASLYEGEGEEK